VTAGRDHIAAAYFAIVALLQSPIISPATRRQLEILRDKLEGEMAADLNSDIANAYHG
jgi:hypothetical protein